MVLFVGIFFYAGEVCGQVQKKNAPSRAPVDIECITSALKAMNVSMDKFDFTPFNNKTYIMKFFIDEYENGVKTSKSQEREYGETKLLLSKMGLPEKNLMEFKREMGLDKDEKVFTRLSTISIYIIPKNDSTAMISVDMKGMGAFGVPIRLKTINGLTEPAYNNVPFKLVPSSEKKINIPLVAYCSFWWDKNFNIARGCRESEEAEPNMSDKFFQLVPHYYVVGVRLEETAE